MFFSLVRCFLVLFITTAALQCENGFAEGKPFRVGTFQVDATPPVGSILAYQVMEGKTSTLWAKGIVLLGDEKPIVLVAVDWLGVGGDGHTRFRETIAKSVGTTVDRVAVHTLHQHDAPRFDLSTESNLGKIGLPGKTFNVAFGLSVIHQCAAKAKKAMETAEVVTHVGLGRGWVDKVASNRRIISKDGKRVIHTRWTTTRDAKVRAFPVGIIDPYVKAVSFYQGDKLLVSLSYYATHPQSYYMTKKADSDFPGMAREQREKKTGSLQIHFNGAGGNITAGKYNDGAKENRPLLAKRLAKGMRDAFLIGSKSRFAVTGSDLKWNFVPVVLPPGDHITKEKLLAVYNDEKQKFQQRMFAAKRLAFLRRCEAKEPIDVTCLSIGRARVLHLPGELFIEYQLAAQKLRPELFVAMAAYGDYAPGYIGTKLGYERTGGYETSDRATAVGAGVEKILMDAIEKLLE